MFGNQRVSMWHLLNPDGRRTRLALVVWRGLSAALIVGACSSQPIEPKGVEPGSSSGPELMASSASGVSGSSAPAPSSVDPVASDFILPEGAPGASNPGATSGDACRLAILGNPGDNPGANFAQWINERGPVVDRYLAGAESEGFTLAELATYQVLLLDKLPPETVVGLAPSELAEWVEGGGKVIALSGYGDYPEIVAVQNQLLEPLGVGFVSETPVWGPVTQFVQHQITEGLTSLTFVGGREISHADADEVIMSFGDPAVAAGVVATRASGRMFLFGDEWVTFDSEWVAMPEIEQFWINVFDWLGGCKLTRIPMVN